MERATDWIRLWRELVEVQALRWAAGNQDEERDNSQKSKAHSFDAQVRQRWAEPDSSGRTVLAALEEQPGATVLDIGAGTGSWAALLARRARLVTAVEPSPVMIKVMEENLATEDMNNVQIVQGAWPDVDVGTHDFSLCSHAMYGYPDLPTFLRRMIEVTDQTCFLVMRAPTINGVLAEAAMRVWGHPHDSPNFQVGYNVMLQMGIFPNVLMEDSGLWDARTNDSLEEALTDVKRRLGLLDVEPSEHEAFLQDLLRRRLTWQDGQYVWPPGVRSALVYWEAKSQEKGASRPRVHQAGRSLVKRAGDGRARISFADALAETLGHVLALGSEEVDLTRASGRVAAQDMSALVDCPSMDASLKDGYAVHSADIAAASPQHPVQLRLDGLAAAGAAWTGTVREGMAVRTLTGAPIPRGADAVVSGEFTSLEGDIVTVVNDAEPGRNILRRGSDVAAGQRIVATGELLRPTKVGLLAAAGHGWLRVFRRPRVAILSTGDEVVAPGDPLAEGKLYASNLVTLASWCTGHGMAVTTTVVPDSKDQIRAKLLACLQDHDAILTSGGAWTSERDLVVHLLDELGWEKIYHGVRIGPGKAVGFGLWQGKPVFCLPGGPSSNHMAFLQLALPALHRLEGRTQPGLPVQVARLAQSIQGQKDWTQFVHGCLERSSTGLVFHPLRMKSRLQEMAQMEALVQIPEGTEWLEAGAMAPVQLLMPNLIWGE